MKQDAFTGGVGPGGLWNQNDIRILICYVLSSVNSPLSGEDLGNIFQGKALANYFEVTDALAALEAQNHVRKTEAQRYEITETGREIGESLDVTLPLSVRDKALEAAVTLLSRARLERENSVVLCPTEKGVQVTFLITDGEMDLMSLSLYVPDMAQAQLVKENFYRDPGAIYQLLLAGLTRDKDLIGQTFQAIP